MTHTKTLDDLSDFPAKPARPRPAWLRPVLVGLGMVSLSAAILVVLLIGLLALVFGGSDQTTKTIAGPEAARAVAHWLVQWELFGPPIHREPEYSQIRRTIAERMRGMRGFSESSGWNGDGTDYYEVDLAPDLVAELRTKLAQSSLVKSNLLNSGPIREHTAPDWWPTRWPPGTVSYDYQFRFLILTPDSTRAWFKVIRM